MEEVGTKSGRLAYDRGLTYEDITYRLTSADRTIGTFKDYVLLRDATGAVLDEVPVLWERRAFLSSTPDRVILGARPSRVFLRCADHTVELTKILSTPGGVAAAVSSAREVTVWLADGWSGLVDGTIEVGTTAPGSPPLRIRVVRYVAGADVDGPSRESPESDRRPALTEG